MESREAGSRSVSWDSSETGNNFKFKVIKTNPEGDAEDETYFNMIEEDKDEEDSDEEKPPS